MKILSALLVLFSVSSAAAEVPPARIAIMNMQKAIQNVEEGKKARETLQKDWEGKQKKLQEEGAKVQKAMEDLRKQTMVMDQKTLQEKEATIQQQIMRLRELDAKSQQEFQKRDMEVSEPIIKKIRGLVAKLSKDKGYTIVLDGSEHGIIYSENTDDITDEVIKLYDKK